MSMEYAVQMKIGDEWIELCMFMNMDGDYATTTNDLETAKLILNTARKSKPFETIRLACREVGDWCECREEK